MKEKAKTEEEMRDTKAPWPKNRRQLSEYIKSLTEREHDYGTCVYAMSLAATAAFNYVAHELGCTGFQASCADMDILRRTRHMESGFRIIDYNKLLYPQYLDEEHFPTMEVLLRENKDRLADQAIEKLKDADEFTSKAVVAHWKMLADSKGV